MTRNAPETLPLFDLPEADVQLDLFAAVESEIDTLALNYITQAASEVLGDRQAAEAVAFKAMASDRVMYAALCYIAESVEWETLTAAVRDALAADEPEVPEVPPAGTRVRVARRGGAIGTVQAPDPIGAWFGRAHKTRPTVSIKFDGAGYGLNYPEDVEVI